MKRTLYDLLGVAETATDSELRAAFPSLLKRINEALERGDNDALNELKFAREGFDMLTSPHRRANYDASLARIRATPPPALPPSTRRTSGHVCAASAESERNLMTASLCASTLGRLEEPASSSADAWQDSARRSLKGVSITAQAPRSSDESADGPPPNRLSGLVESPKQRDAARGRTELTGQQTQLAGQTATSSAMCAPPAAAAAEAGSQVWRSIESTDSSEAQAHKLTDCPDCGARVSRRAENCPKCGAPIHVKEASPTKAPNVKQPLGIMGAALLFFGVFAPIISVPFMGSLNYFQSGKGDGIIILILAVVAFMLVMRKNYKPVLYAGLASLAVLLFTFGNFHYQMSKVKAEMASDLSGNPFRGLADVALQAVQLQWGWGVLLVGAILLVASAIVGEKPQ